MPTDMLPPCSLRFCTDAALSRPRLVFTVPGEMVGIDTACAFAPIQNTSGVRGKEQKGLQGVCLLTLPLAAVLPIIKPDVPNKFSAERRRRAESYDSQDYDDKGYPYGISLSNHLSKSSNFFTWSRRRFRC